MKAFIGFVVFIVVIAAIGGCAYISTQNHLIELDEQCIAAEQEIDNQLQRRYDLIPGYAEIVKKYANLEESLFTSFAEARSTLANAKTTSEKASAAQTLETVSSRLLAVAESYPELKSNENFLRFQDEFAGTENRLAVARKRHGDAVKIYNATARKFPGSLFHYPQRDYYEFSVSKDALKKAPDMKSILND